MKQTIPHPLVSIIPLLALIAMIATVMRVVPDDALSGASQISMMIATAICVALSMSIYKIKWQVFEDSITGAAQNANFCENHQEISAFFVKNNIFCLTLHTT